MGSKPNVDTKFRNTAHGGSLLSVWRAGFRENSIIARMLIENLSGFHNVWEYFLKKRFLIVCFLWLVRNTQLVLQLEVNSGFPLSLIIFEIMKN